MWLSAIARSSSAETSAISRPRPTMTKCSAVSAISLIRCDETNTVRPSAGEVLEQVADPEDALGVEAVDRLVEHQRLAGRRAARTAMPSRWPMPSEKPPARRSATSLEADDVEHLVDPAVGDAGRGGEGPQVVARRAARVDGLGVEQRADLARAARAWSASGRPLTVARPDVGASRPRIMRIVVDLPAPFGPRKPVTMPGLDGEAEVVDGEWSRRSAWSGCVTSIMHSILRIRRPSRIHHREASRLLRGSSSVPGPSPPRSGRLPQEVVELGQTGSEREHDEFDRGLGRGAWSSPD